LKVGVEDNGSGLPATTGGQVVPRSLGARIAKLGGMLEMASSIRGVRLAMSIPLSAAAP
jgi:signal transduction histidine kinase